MAQPATKRIKLTNGPAPRGSISAGSQSTPKPAVILHLYPTHFTINNHDTTHQYNGPLKFFLDAINRQELPAESCGLFKDSDYHRGCIYAEVRDYRYSLRAVGRSKLEDSEESEESGGSKKVERDIESTEPYVRIHVLRPTQRTLWTDIATLGKGQGLTEDAALEVEAKLLLETQEPLILDPNPNIGRIRNVQAYNDQKYRIQRKRPLDWAAAEEDNEKKRERDRMMLLMDEQRETAEFYPKFSKFSFVEDWRKKKAQADTDPLRSIEGRTNLTNMDTGVDRMGAVVRTLLFKQVYQTTGLVMHTTLNVYQGFDGHYYCILRWGESPYTGKGGKGRILGNTLKFRVGNHAAAWFYCQEFKTHYLDVLGNKLVSDTVGPKLSPAALVQIATGVTSQSSAASQPATPATTAAVPAPTPAAAPASTVKPKGTKAKNRGRGKGTGKGAS
ncbi:Spt20 family-domain-containing protein [Gaertneriomyces semiglobifer]|nr:Spt20 family-domain-containing protein [Gaertneriomyces semiglobifer]